VPGLQGKARLIQRVGMATVANRLGKGACLGCPKSSGPPESMVPQRLRVQRLDFGGPSYLVFHSALSDLE